MAAFAEGLGGLIAAIMIAALAIYLFILAFIIAIPFVAGGAVLYYSGQELRRQTYRYELTGMTYNALAGLGLGAVGIATLVVTHTHLCAFFVVPLSLLLFLPSAAALLGTWAFVKALPFKQRVDLLREEETRRANGINALKNHNAALTSENQAIVSHYGALREEKQKLERIVRAISLRDAQVWTLKTKEWRAEHSLLPDEVLAQEKKGILARLEDSNAATSLTLQLRASLLRLEEIRRSAGEPNTIFERNDRILAEIVEARQRLEAEREALQEERTRAESAHQAFRASRIVLD